MRRFCILFLILHLLTSILYLMDITTKEIIRYEMKSKWLLSLLIASASVSAACAQTHTLDVNARKVGAAVQPTMYGVFFEDINYAADGGLYGELVKNRSFEFPQALMGWQSFGNVEVRDDGPFGRCPHYVVLGYSGHNELATGLQNEGYFGIGVEKGESYRFSVWAKAISGEAEVEVSLVDPCTMAEHQEFASARLKVVRGEWRKYELMLTSPCTVPKANLRLLLKGRNAVALEHVSLFPKHTFRDRANGMRRDLAQALYDLHPGVLRFPGGCIVEGEQLAHRYQWKNTIGPVENRPLNNNRWQSTFTYRLFPDYYQSYGLGFFEYFQLAEDIGAEPLPVLNVGMACQYQNWEKPEAHVPVDSLQPYIQDCLDLIEFANGDTATVWGRKRAEMGHVEPFGLKYIAVGNEQWDTLYYERLRPFVKAIRARYPDIRIVGSAGPDPDGDKFERGWKAMTEMGADLVDEHYYRDERWFLSHALRYDRYDRKGPRVFAGEYACHGSGKKWNHYEASLCEAAFMTGLERNADIVDMATYAPLFAHVDGWQWRPDLIWYDNTRMFRSASYYVQQMYSCHKGTNVLPLTMGGQPVVGQQGQDGLFASAVVDRRQGEVVVKVVNTSDKPQDIRLNILGLKGRRSAVVTTLHSADMDAENTLDNPCAIVPVESDAMCESAKDAAVLRDSIPEKSFRMYVIR